MILLRFPGRLAEPLKQVTLQVPMQQKETSLRIILLATTSVLLDTLVRPAADFTVKHGLDKKPKWVVVTPINAGDRRRVYHEHMDPSSPHDYYATWI